MIDTHCHLNLVDTFPDPEAEIEEAQRAGVDRLVVIGIDVDSSRRALALAERYANVYATVGIHPNSAVDYDESQLRQIAELIPHPKVVALGEVGLDFHWQIVTPDRQEACLRDQLDLARELETPVVFHCRKAYSALLDVLEARPVHKYLFHCFSGSFEDAGRALALGGMFGVDGPVTYPKATELREVLRSLPHDRLLLETDSPYLTPAPYRGKPNRPAYLRYVNDALANVVGLTPEECDQVTTANAERFFGL